MAPLAHPPVAARAFDSLAALAGSPAGLTAVERRVIALARRDGLATLRSPRPLGRLLRRLFGVPPVNPLADPRLEALRRAAVLHWHEQRGARGGAMCI